MAAKTTVYKRLRHPELDTPILAVEWIGTWHNAAGEPVGIIVRYPGEGYRRHLTYGEVARLGREGESCGASAT